MQRSAVRDEGSQRTFARPSPPPRRARSATPYLIAVLLAAFLPATWAQLAEAPALFDPPAQGFAEPAFASLDSPAWRTRSLVIQTQLFTALPPGQTRRVRLPLFADRDYTAIVTQQEGAGDPFFGWRGRLEGYVNGHFSAVFHEGALVVQVSDGRGGEFNIRPVPGGGHQLAEPWPGVQGVCGTTNAPDPAFAPAQADAVFSPASITPSGPDTYVDVLILYTPNARNAAGGPAGIQAKARQCVTDSNWRLSRSSTHTYLRLVGLEEINYDDSSGDVHSHLRLLYAPNFGEEAILHEPAMVRRAATGADLVCLLVNGGAGTHFRGSSLDANWPLVVEWNQDTWCFTHHIGHCLGCRHEGGAGYNHGFIHTETWILPFPPFTIDEQRVTVMHSYFDVTRRTDYFSNPGINFPFTGDVIGCGGACADVNRPLGVANVADNARWLNENRANTAINKQAIFYVNSAGGNGDATEASPENDLVSIYHFWFSAAEVNPAQSATVYIASGNTVATSNLGKKSRLEKWGGGAPARIVRLQ